MKLDVTRLDVVFSADRLVVMVTAGRVAAERDGALPSAMC
jgi:hypothetical protein